MFPHPLRSASVTLRLPIPVPDKPLYRKLDSQHDRFKFHLYGIATNQANDSERRTRTALHRFPHLTARFLAEVGRREKAGTALKCRQFVGTRCFISSSQ